MRWRQRRRRFPAGPPCRRASVGACCNGSPTCWKSRQEELARLIAEETGNALRTQARGEAKFVVDSFRYFGGLASELRGTSLPLGKDILSYTRREPIGVVGAIVPWNAPGAACRAQNRAGDLCRQHHRAEGGGGRAARRADDRRRLP